MADAVAAEGDTATFLVSLSKPTNKDVKIRLKTLDGSANANQDYASKAGIWIIPAGATSRTIYVDIRSDNVSESEETFTLLVSVASNNAVVIDGEAIGLIGGP